MIVRRGKLSVLVTLHCPNERVEEDRRQHAALLQPPAELKLLRVGIPYPHLCHRADVECFDEGEQLRGDALARQDLKVFSFPADRYFV